MNRSGLLVGVAAVLAGTTVLMGVFGLVYNPILLVAAVPFAAATYFLWSSATGRLGARMRERARSQPVNGDGGGDDWRARDPTVQRSAVSGRPSKGPDPADVEAARVLGVDHDADEATVRRAFRERARDLHPDAGGDEAAFRRVRAAYERLRSDR